MDQPLDDAVHHNCVMHVDIVTFGDGEFNSPATFKLVIKRQQIPAIKNAAVNERRPLVGGAVVCTRSAGCGCLRQASILLNAQGSLHCNEKHVAGCIYPLFRFGALETVYRVKVYALLSHEREATRASKAGQITQNNHSIFAVERHTLLPCTSAFSDTFKTAPAH
jgi:hypothetical protein